MEIAEVKLLIAGVAGESLVTKLLEVSHCRQFDINSLKSSIEQKSECKRIDKTHIAQIVLKNAFEKKIFRKSEEDSNLKPMLLETSFIQGLGNRGYMRQEKGT